MKNKIISTGLFATIGGLLFITIFESSISTEAMNVLNIIDGLGIWIFMTLAAFRLNKLPDTKKIR